MQRLKKITRTSTQCLMTWQTLPQRFKIKNDKDTVLVGKKGTRICLKANSLIDSRGRPLKGYVKIELNEYYDMADLLLNNLNTESGQQVLETGGTVKLTLKSRGKEVFVKDGSSYALYIPSAQTQNNMSWFDGEHHDQDLLASRVNWVPTENFAQTTTNFRQSAFNWFGFYKKQLKLFRIDWMVAFLVFWGKRYLPNLNASTFGSHRKHPCEAL